MYKIGDSSSVILFVILTVWIRKTTDSKNLSALDQSRSRFRKIVKFFRAKQNVHQSCRTGKAGHQSRVCYRNCDRSKSRFQIIGNCGTCALRIKLCCRERVADFDRFAKNAPHDLFRIRHEVSRQFLRLDFLPCFGDFHRSQGKITQRDCPPSKQFRTGGWHLNRRIRSRLRCLLRRWFTHEETTYDIGGSKRKEHSKNASKDRSRIQSRQNSCPFLNNRNNPIYANRKICFERESTRHQSESGSSTVLSTLEANFIP